MRTLPGDTTEGSLNEFRAVVERAKAEDAELDAIVEDTTHIMAPLGTDEEATIVAQSVAACREVLGTATVSGVPSRSRPSRVATPVPTRGCDVNLS